MAKPNAKPYTVRGITYANTDNASHIKIGTLTELYLVILALEGDKLAEEILNSAGVIFCDIYGNQVWPVLQQP